MKRPVLDSDDDQEDQSAGSSRSPPSQKRARRLTGSSSRQQHTGLRTPSASASVEHDLDLGRASSSQRPARGHAAQIGIIKRMRLERFLCHHDVELHLHPNLNFLTGANGSGKSAVLTAISVGLGAKSSKTGRGNSVVGLINDHEDTARITICIKNEGPDAYRPADYGAEILVERSLFRRGNPSSYKLMSIKEKVISTKREELDRILDHMNIQIDNPINILSQDDAKAFLAGSTPRDKYKFFLDGTSLSTLQTEMSNVLVNIQAIETAISDKRSVLPEQEERLKEVEQQVQAAQDASAALEELQEAEGEALWRMVKDQEKIVGDLDLKVEKEEARQLKIQDALAEHEAEHAAARAAAEAREEELDLDARATAISGTRDAIASAREEEREVSRRVRRNDRQDIQNARTDLVNEISQARDKIQSEQEKLAVDHGPERAARDEQIAILRESLNQPSADIPLHHARLETLAASLPPLQAALEGDMQRITRIDAEFAATQSRKANLVGSRGGGPLAAYGRDLQRLLNDIHRTSWRGQKPIGPLGLGVKLRAGCESYARLVQSVIGPLLCSFAITTADDRGKLLQLLRAHRNSFYEATFPQIVIFDPDPTVHLPESEHTTLLSLLQIDDWRIRNLLVDRAGVELTYVEPDRTRASALADRTRKTVWSSYCNPNDRDAVFYKYFTRGNSLSASYQNQWKGPGLFAVDHEEEIRDAERELVVQRQTKNRLIASRNEKQAEIQRINAETTRTRQTLGRLNEQIRRMQADIDSLVEANRERDPPNIAGMQVVLDEKEAALEDVDAQLGDNQRALDEEEAAREAVLERKTLLEAEAGRLAEEKITLTDELSGLALVVAKALSDIRDRQVKLTQSEGKLAELQRQRADSAAILQERTDGATEIHPERMEPRTDAQIRAHIANLKQRIRLRRGAGAMDLGAAIALQAKLSKSLEKARKTLDEMHKLRKCLTRAREIRTDKIAIWRRDISLRAKQLFLQYLSVGNFSGKLTFNHQAETLEIKVFTDDLEGDEAHSAQKDPNQLSGGEKSFSTVALLMSFWESVRSPIRGLDEFDVFMDAVRRRMAVQLLIDTAKQTPHTQFFLLTPLDMTGVVPGDDVKILHFQDPERHQREA